MKDSTTGQMSGTFVDILNRMGSNLGLKVQWMDGETPWGQHIEGLNEDRYDIVGSPVWANPVRGQLATLSRPAYYSGIGIYVRQNDNRFPNDWSVGEFSQRVNLINRPEVRIATIDGETGDLIARTQFPNAQRVALPQNADIAEMFLNVANGKADVAFAEPYFAFLYLKNNPSKIRNIAESAPIRVLGNVFMFKKNEPQMKQMIDTALEDLLNSGYVDIVLNKYEPAPGLFYRDALPYRSK
jgi:ABC-type amino acid transport substrate-binding protein